MAVVRGRKWQHNLDEGKVRDIKELTEILATTKSSRDANAPRTSRMPLNERASRVRGGRQVELFGDVQIF